LWIVAAKNSRKRRAARSLASATIAGTTIEAAMAAEILGALATGATVSWCHFPKSTSTACQSPLQRSAGAEIRPVVAPVRQTVGLS
jgi:hypothetical protein